MLDRLEGLEEEYQHVLDRMNDPAVLSDQHALRDAGRRFKELEPIVTAYRSYQAAQGDLEAAKEMAAESTGTDDRCCENTALNGTCTPCNVTLIVSTGTTERWKSCTVNVTLS